MTFRRIHLAGGVLLAGLALTLAGCSDTGSTDAGKQPTTQQTTTTQPTTSKAPADQAGDESKGGDGKGFCAAVANGGGQDLSQWKETQADPEFRAKLTKRYQALTDAAPGELKQPMQDITDAYEKIQSGEVTEADQDVITKYAAAIQTLNKWLVANCPDLKMPSAG